MLYNLPDGRVIIMSIDEFLDLDHIKIQGLIASGHGDMPNNPFYFSHLTDKSKVIAEIKDELGNDYISEDDDIDTYGPINLNDLPEDH